MDPCPPVEASMVRRYRPIRASGGGKMNTVKELPSCPSTAEFHVVSSREHERGKLDLVPDDSMGQGPAGRRKQSTSGISVGTRNLVRFRRICIFFLFSFLDLQADWYSQASLPSSFEVTSCLFLFHVKQADTQRQKPAIVASATS